MDIFISSTKRKYRERLVNREEQWPPCHTDKLVRLELVERKQQTYTYSYQSTNQYDKRTPLAYKDLFGVHKGKKQVRKVLIEGDAGIGKTTFCTAVSEDWANDGLFQQFMLLFLLPLRHKKVASVGSIMELIKLLHTNQEVCSCVASYLEKEEGDNILIVADGWDELGESERQSGSFLYELFFGDILPFASVILTSRPSISVSLHRLPCIDRFVEVCGFSTENIKGYILSEFAFDQREKQAEGLLAQLDSNPLVESICSIPLNCAIICHLWRAFKETLPATMTEIYTKMILNIMIRNLRKKGISGGILSLSSFDTLPMHLQRSWWLLCKLAFHLMTTNQISFSQEELIDFYPPDSEALKDIFNFGLLHSVESVFATGCGISFHFLHFTFHEYLASLHMVKQPIEFQVQALISHGKSFRFAMVWRFFCGLSYSNITAVAVNPPTQSTVLSELYTNHREELVLCQCAFESNNMSFARKVFLKFCASGQSLQIVHPHTAFDCAAVSYVIASMQVHSYGSYGININFNSSGVRDNQIRALADVLDGLKGSVQVGRLSLTGNKLANSSVNYFFLKASIAFSTLTYIDLGKNMIGAEAINSLKRVYSCRHLDLSDNPLRESGIRALESVISAGNLSSLYELHLQACLPLDAEMSSVILVTLMEAISTHCPNIDLLDLSRNKLSKLEALTISKSLAQFVQHKGSRTKSASLHLNETDLGDDGLMSFVLNLTSPCTSALKLKKNNIHGHGASFLAGSDIEKLGITQLDLEDNPLGLEGVIAIGKMLGNEELWKLNLSRCQLATIFEESVVSLNPNDDIYNVMVRDVGEQLCELPQSSTLKWLYLDGNVLTGGGTYIIAGFMSLCPHLTHLFCNHCAITSKDLKKLFNQLTELKALFSNLCSELESWSLSNNEIDDSGVCILLELISSVFPNFGYSGYANIYIDSNPASQGMITKLEEEIKKQKKMQCWNQHFNFWERSWMEKHGKEWRAQLDEWEAEWREEVNAETGIQMWIEKKKERWKEQAWAYILSEILSDDDQWNVKWKRKTGKEWRVQLDEWEAEWRAEFIAKSGFEMLSREHEHQGGQSCENQAAATEIEGQAEAVEDQVTIKNDSQTIENDTLASVAVIDRHQIIQAKENQTIEISRSGAHIDSQATRSSEAKDLKGLGTVNQATKFNENQTVQLSKSQAASINTTEVKEDQKSEIKESEADEDQTVVIGCQINENQVAVIRVQATEIRNRPHETNDNQAAMIKNQVFNKNQVSEGKESQAIEIGNCEAMISSESHVKESQLASTDDEMMYCEIDFSTSGVSLHLGLIADSMYEWEGSVAEQLNLTQSDIAAIKKKHPGDLHLQTRAALEKWKEKLGRNATYGNLMCAFKKANNLSYADKVREVYYQELKKQSTGIELLGDIPARRSQSKCEIS